MMTWMFVITVLFSSMTGKVEFRGFESLEQCEATRATIRVDFQRDGLPIRLTPCILEHEYGD